MNASWKQQTAAAIVTHEAPVVTNGQQPQHELFAHLLNLLAANLIPAGSLGFAQSVRDAYRKYGSWTERQFAAVANLTARATNTDEPQPVEGPDAALGAALEAALTRIAPRDVDFATSLLSGFKRYGSFTDRQRPHAERLVYSATAAPAAPSAPEKAAATTCPNICSKVSLDGFSRFTVGQLALSLKNDGSCIWVKWDGAIVGVIDHATTEYRTTRRYVTSPVAHLNAQNALLAIEADPLAAARENGIKTGRCSCCSRPLTDPVSIGYGIGPICRERGFGVRL